MNRLRACVAAGLASTVVLLAGCGIGTAAPPVATQGVAISGHVHGGQFPVGSANIALFATTSTGYNGTLLALATTTSGTSASGGAFSITSSYTCPAGQQAYLVATGGDPGIGAGTDNSAIFMVTALGPCENIGANTVVDFDEVSTVAAAYALSGFVPAGGAGFTEAAVKAATPGTGTAMAGITTKSTNTQGLKDAFANAGNIVNPATGQAYTTTGGGNGTVPASTINAIADILQDCANTSGPSSSLCTSLFNAAQPPAATVIAKPVNIFQAALDIAQYPANNVSTLFGLITADAAFPTSLVAAPNDWTIGITYTNTNLVSGTGLGINASDDIYVSGAGYLINFTPLGAPITGTNLLAGDSSISATDTLRNIAFDPSGNLFVTDGALTGVYEYSSIGAITKLDWSVSPTSEANNNSYGIAVDQNGDVWSSSYSKATCSSVTCPLIEFVSGTSYSPVDSFSNGATPTPTFFNAPQPTGALGGSRGTAFDVNNGNIWITAIDDNLGEVFKVTASSTAAATATAAPTQLTGFGTEVTSPSNNTAYGTIAVAVDSTDRAWFVVAGGPSTTGSHATAAIPGAIYPVSSTGTVGTAVTNSNFTAMGTIAVDGNNNLFVTNGSAGSNTTAVVEYNPTIGALVSPTTSAGFIPSSTGTISEFSYLAIDRSGAVWALSGGNGSSHPANLLQILGVGAPTDPVLADGKYGVKP